MGKKRLDEFRLYCKHESDLIFLPLTYFYSAHIHLAMPQSLLALLIAHSLSLESLHPHILDFSRPSKTPYISRRSSPSSFTSVSSRSSIFGISVLTEDHLRQSILSLHTPSSSMRMTFPPTHTPYKALSSSDLWSAWRLKLTASLL